MKNNIENAPFYKYDEPYFRYKCKEKKWSNALIDYDDFHYNDIHREYWGGFCCEIYDASMTHYVNWRSHNTEPDKLCIVNEDKYKPCCCQKGFLLASMYSDYNEYYNQYYINVIDHIEEYGECKFKERVKFIIEYAYMQ